MILSAENATPLIASTWTPAPYEVEGSFWKGQAQADPRVDPVHND